MGNANLAVLHLLLRLKPLNRALRSAVAQRSSVAAKLERPDLTALCVTNDHVSQLLDQADSFTEGRGIVASSTPMGFRALPPEVELEQQYRQEAARRGEELPLDYLAKALGLTAFEQEALLLCVATEMHRAFERIYAFILDDLTRRFPCIELLAGLTATSVTEELERRPLVGRYGRLRQSGLLEPYGESTTELRLQLRPGSGALEFLTGRAPYEAGLWNDPCAVDTTRAPVGLSSGTTDELSDLGAALQSARIGIVGLWGRQADALDDAAVLIARSANMPLRRLSPEHDGGGGPIEAVAGDALRAAAVQGAVLQIRTDDLHQPESRRLAANLTERLSECGLPVILTGKDPWRPVAVLSGRHYAECLLDRADYETRRSIWSNALPAVEDVCVDDLASRFHMSPREVTAVVRVADTAARLAGNGKPAPIQEHLNDACTAVARGVSGRLLALVKPRRSRDDLILPSELHDQVLDVARFSRVLPRVRESWGFGRISSGGSGIKALFTGDPGTGKTLAAEVIAAELSVPLLKVNIGQVLSRWVGEGEKNLDAAFQEASACHAAMFFDEADALFGKRGEVSRGTDRYANTEVSHLLQRLEDHDGLVILASNLRENIDPAFMRRMQVVVHFPRPTLKERRRIWDVAFPSQAPLSPCINLDAVSRLDLTGAGIVSAAHTSALLAADAGVDCITMTHVFRGIERQFRREARVLTAAELGPLAELVPNV